MLQLGYVEHMKWYRKSKKIDFLFRKISDIENFPANTIFGILKLSLYLNNNLKLL